MRAVAGARARIGWQGNVIDNVKPSYAIQAGTWGPPKEAKKENVDDIFGKKPVSVNPQPSTIASFSRHPQP